MILRYVTCLLINVICSCVYNKLKLDHNSRYYKFVPNLPERLQPQCMRLHGLRACVIRALHYSYFRTSEGEGDDMSYLRQEEPHSLVKRKCILMWHKVNCKLLFVRI